MIDWKKPTPCTGEPPLSARQSPAATRALALMALSAAMLMVAPAYAQEQDCTIRINYRDVDINAVIAEMSMNTGRTFVIGQGINGRVTLETPPDFTVCRDEAWTLFQDILNQNGYVATPLDNGQYAILPRNLAQRAGAPVGSDEDIGGMVTRIFRLQYLDAQEAARNIAQINTEGAVSSAIRSSNSLLVVDTTRNMARIASVLKALDVDRRSFRTIALAHASARDVATVLGDVARDLAEESGNTAGRVSIVPVDTSNTILVRAEPAMMSQLVNIVRELDRQGETSSDVAVIALQHADADEILPLLREVVGAGGSSTPPAAGGVSGSGRAGQNIISAYAPTNSIIVKGDAVLRREVETIIDHLDVRRAQVLVEAIIVDISDSTAREIGAQYFLSGNGTNGIPFSTNVSGQNPNILTAAGALFTQGGDGDAGNPAFGNALRTAAIGSLFGVSGFGLGAAGTFGGDDNVFSALITAVQQDVSSRVLSTPSVVTLDNETASLSDGQEIPITTGEQIGDNFSNAFRTVSREQVGIILEVTPQITAGGTVLLDIRQEISSIAGPINATSTDLITNNSVIATRALVDDGDILVIGGLISDEQGLQEDKVPFLGDVPVLGNLFKTRSRSRVRNNLMIFIRPTIIRDRATAQAATRAKFDYIRAQEVLNDARAQEDFNRLLNDATGIPSSREQN